MCAGYYGGCAANQAKIASLKKTMARSHRIEIIRRLEEKRKSRILTYICSDRPGMGANIAEDAIWPIYDCTRALSGKKKVPQIDLFVYSRGGSVEVPWRIVSMLREHCERLSFLVPYRSHSASTMIAIGCDEIVAGKKAELGPIDPALNIRDGNGGTAAQMEIRVEDVMSYVNFLRDKAGLNDQMAIAENIKTLGDQIKPHILGSIYRTHSHIRQVAEKLLKSHVKPLENGQIKQIIEELAEKIYLHGHAISRAEGEAMGLPIVIPDDDTDELMWQLLEQYEETMLFRKPIDPHNLLGSKDVTEVENIVLAMSECTDMTWAFSGKLVIQRARQVPPNLNINIQFGIHLPPGLPESAIPNTVAEQINQQLNQIVPKLVQEQVRLQSPEINISHRLESAAWNNVTAAGI